MFTLDRNKARSPVTAATIRPTQLPEIELHCPTELSQLVSHLRDGACALAGGTDIILRASQRGEPRRLAWTGAVAEMQGLDSGADFIRIGAAVTLSQLVRSKPVRDAAPAVADGARLIGSVQLRNQATLVGNLCTASPAGDTIPGLLLHDAKVSILGESGSHRVVDVDDFLIGPGKTALSAGELVLGLQLSPLARGEVSVYQRFTQREALDLAFASVAARVLFESDNRTVRTARLALGAVAPTAIEASDAAVSLCGTQLDDATLRTCARIAAAAGSPISDHRAGADYRRQLVAALVIGVLTEVRRRAGTHAGDLP